MPKKRAVRRSDRHRRLSPYLRYEGCLDFGLYALDVGGGHFRDGQACNPVARGDVEIRTAPADRQPRPPT